MLDRESAVHFKPELGIPFATEYPQSWSIGIEEQFYLIVFLAITVFIKKVFFYIGSFGISSVLLFSILFE